MNIITNKKEFLMIGIIGCGWVTEYIKPVTKNLENLKIVAAVDPILERANKIAGKEHSYEDPSKMYKNENIDAVYIATPHNLHKPMIKQALEEGKHVFCEKPVSTTIENAREIFELDKKYPSLKIGFNYQYRYDYNCYNLTYGVKEGHIGKVYYANCNVFFSREIDYFNKGIWRTKLGNAGGGTLLGHGSHILDIMIWALGEPISVMGKIDNLKFNIEVEDIGFGIIKFENGVYGQINDSMIIKPRKKRINDCVELDIFGEIGSCSYKGPWPFSSLNWYGVEDFKIKENVAGKSHFSECLGSYLNWVLYDTPFFNTVEESSRVLRLISAIYKSSKTGKEVKVEKL
ncbi:MAG: Gfo/Idh/MocA family protein [Candidatus Hodarchaeota archaeon]